MADFLNDLDRFIAEKYDDYTIISSLRGFKAPEQKGLKRVYSLKDTTYNFKPEGNAYRLKAQINIDFMLRQLKLIPKNFSDVFSGYPVSLRQRFLFIFRKNLRFGKFLSLSIKRYNADFAALSSAISKNPVLLQSILMSRFYPSKITLFKIFLFIGIAQTDAEKLLAVFRYSYDSSSIPDLIVKYLNENRIYNFEMIRSAFLEYNIPPLL